ncbi:unnamed protein product, partial [Rotaria magnacalcarata]
MAKKGRAGKPVTNTTTKKTSTPTTTVDELGLSTQPGADMSEKSIHILGEPPNKISATTANGSSITYDNATIIEEIDLMLLEGLQVHNLQKQMNEYNNVITNQQQLLTELIDKRERDERNLNVHWPKIRDSHDSNGPKIAPPRRNEHTNPPPQRHTHNSARLNRYGQNDVRPQRQPSNRRPERPLQRPKLRDFLPHNNRQISVTPKNKKVNFSKDTSTKWLKENAHTCTDNQKNTTAQGDGTHIKTLARFGYKAAPHIEKLTRAFFDIQVWQFYMELGTKKNNPHWAKEVIASAKTRDPTKTKQVCEQKILRFSEEIAKLTDKVDKIAIDTGLDKNTEGHNEIMFRYMNEMLSIVRRQHELKMKIARSERAEYVAWDQFLKLADATQKTQGLSLKAQLLKTREKYIRYEIAAAHATPQIDMLPKCLTIPNQQDLAIWIPGGDSFISNESPAPVKSIADYARDFPRNSSNRHSNWSGSMQPPRRNIGALHTKQNDSRSVNKQTLLPDLTQIRAEERRLECLEKKGPQAQQAIKSPETDTRCP